MITGGDEFLRTQRCNNNAYNLDSPGTWLDWSALPGRSAFFTFTQRMLAFSWAHPALRTPYWTEGLDRDDDALLDIEWFDPATGGLIDGEFWSDASRPVVAWRVDADEHAPDPARSIAVAWNRGTEFTPVIFPPAAAGMRWHRVADTAAWFEAESNAHAAGSEHPLAGNRYDMHPRSVLVLLER